MEGSGLCAWGLYEQHVSQRRFPPGEKVAAGGGAIKQHISPNAQLTKQSWQPALYQPFSLLWARRPLGWHRETHRLERYRSRQFGGSSALNHCLLFKGESFSLQQRNSIKMTAFYSWNLSFHTELYSYPENTMQEKCHTTGRQSVWPLTWSGRWGWQRRHSSCFDRQEKMLSLVLFLFVL